MSPQPTAETEETLPRRFGKYTLLRRMATGGMAEIFLALQRSVAGFEKLIVIKRILPAMNQDRGFIDMLLHEARIAATLSHPNIVQTIDVGQVEGTYFIALEHIHGEDLRSIVRQMKKKSVGHFPLEHAIAIILGMCAGLAYAHERRDLDGTPLNIVHRDVSPQNVLVGFAGDVKVVDFGVAKSGASGAVEQTKSGQLKGKIPYMAPEQARGEEIDHRADIFAIGVMLFELTTGRRLFKGATEYETLKLIIEKEYPRPSWVANDYPQRLEEIVMRALSKDSNERYQSAREMQADLEAFVRDEKLPVSSIALAEFMKSLFEEKLAAQKEALMEGRQLADVLASEVQIHTERTDVGIESGRFTTSSGQTNAAAAVGGSVPPPSRGSGKWAIAGISVVAAAALVGVIAMRKGDDKKSSASTAQSAEPTVVKGTLVVKSDPAGAHIWLNGEVRGEVTPATISGLPLNAPIEVKVGKEGYASKTDRVTLTDGNEVPKNFTLQKGALSVQVAGAPKDATATLDGTAVTLPNFDATPGDSHTLIISAKDYLPKTMKFSGDLAEVKKLDGSLDRKPTAGGLAAAGNGGSMPAVAPPTGTGKLMVSASGGWCNVTVDGRSLGATPTGAVELGAGAHSVTCADAGGKTLAQGARVNVGETTRVKFSL